MATPGAQPQSRTRTEPPILTFALRQMRLVERLVLGLMFGILATDLATLASTLPYIHTTDDKLKCWSRRD